MCGTRSLQAAAGHSITARPGRVEDARQPSAPPREPERLPQEVAPPVDRARRAPRGHRTCRRSTGLYWRGDSLGPSGGAATSKRWQEIRRRSDVRAAERSLAAATVTIGVETSQLYPQVSISGSVGFANTFSGMGSVSSFGGNIGPLLSWTFPNVWVARARIAEAGAAAEAAEAQFDGAVLTALQQTETALDAYVHEIEHNRELKSARDSAAEATDQARTLFRFGRTDILDVLTTESSLATSETALADSDAAIADAQVSVFLALGGGWES